MLDLHTHHRRCGHAAGEIKHYIEAAIAGGLRFIGISDHSPYFASSLDQLHPDTAMAKSEFPHYIREIRELKEEYKDKIEVLVGIESDFFAEHQELYRSIYSQTPLDYVIGSVHHSNGTPIFRQSRWEGLAEEEILREKEIFLETTQQAARSGLFDILGHLDGLKRNQPLFNGLKTERTEQTMKVLGECGVAIELNSSGAHQWCEEWYPSAELLELALHYGVPVTFGSDAHQPEQVGRDYEEASSFLRQLGFRQWALFRNRRRFLIDM
ncbi:histidinol-phosphatase [Paenibacillus sp. CC-CFT747]|nr:histidinol-phosphatase [Paenibacillus sp. CC-CFT747]